MTINKIQSGSESTATGTVFQSAFVGKRILITGHTGFKGGWLTTWLVKQGAILAGYSDRIPSQPSMFEILNLESRIEHHIGDVRDLAHFSAVLNGFRPDFVFHLAAQPIVSISYQDPMMTLSTNVMGTATVLEALRQYMQPCVAVIVTSDKCYENIEWEWGYKETDHLGGKDIYSGSKAAAEVVFHAYFHSFFKQANSKVKLVTVRAGNVIGGGDWAADRLVVDCMKSWAEGKVVEIRSPSATRPWQHVLEPLSGYLCLAARLAQELKPASDVASGIIPQLAPGGGPLVGNGRSLNGHAFNFGPMSEQNRTVLDVLRDLSTYWHFTDSEQAYRVTGNIPFYEAGMLKLNCDKALLDLKWHGNLSYHECVKLVSLWYYSFYHEKADMYALTMQQIGEYEQLARERNLKWAAQ
jgi:CDP-glucose 4,6-dehydratase